MLEIKDASLRALNTWGCGGRCSLLLKPADSEEAREAVCRAAASCGRRYLLGGGSNVLISDIMPDTAVILTTSLSSMTFQEIDGGAAVRVGGGFSVKKLLAAAIQHGWGGLEFLTGIPGTVGGALAGNAGAGGRGFGPFVESIEGVAADGNIVRWSGGELQWQYRSSPWKAAAPFITEVVLRLPQTSQRNIIENIRHFAELKKGQPIGAKTAGCVFKNPESGTAGAMLDSCGCKELSVGGAIVSPRHANFIENRGNAASSDIFALAEMCRARVFEKYGVRLQYEIKFIGAFQTS